MTPASIPGTPAAARQRASLFFLYHELRTGNSSYSYIVRTEKFRQHLELFASVRRSAGELLRPQITFDDGHISSHDIAAPLLASQGIAAHFFITVGWTGVKPDYMGWTELRALHQAGHTIGAHGWSHALLTRLNDNELQQELSRSRMTLEDKLGTQIATMSLPGGRQNARVLAACSTAGYLHVFTSVPRPEPAPLVPVVGRLNVLSNMQVGWLAQLLDSSTRLLAVMERKQRMKDTAKSLLGDSLYEKLWAVANRREQEGPSI